jgi:hypothetical protein
MLCADVRARALCSAVGGEKVTISVAPNLFRNWQASRADFSICGCPAGSSAGPLNESVAIRRSRFESSFSSCDRSIPIRLRIPGHPVNRYPLKPVSRITSSISVYGSVPVSDHCVEVHRKLLTHHWMFGRLGAKSASARPRNTPNDAAAADNNWRQFMRVSSRVVYANCIRSRIEVSHSVPARYLPPSRSPLADADLKRWDDRKDIPPEPDLQSAGT